MHLLIFSTLLGFAIAAPQYGVPPSAPKSPPSSYGPPASNPPPPPSYGPPASHPPPPPPPPSYAPPAPQLPPPSPPKSPPSPSYAPPSSGPSIPIIPSQHLPSSYGPPPTSSQAVECAPGQVADASGKCVTPIITRSIFLYNAPPQPVSDVGPPPVAPPPKIDYNVVFVKTPEQPKGQEPIVIPPPQQKTIVYVLNQNGQIQGRRVIELPAGPKHNPEVYYLNYDEGDNPQLPGGLSLQQALSSASTQQGKILDEGGKGGAATGGSGYGAATGGSGYGGDAGLEENEIYGGGAPVVSGGCSSCSNSAPSSGY